MSHEPALREHYERLRDRAVAGGSMTLAMRTLVDRGVHAWIDAFGSSCCLPTSRTAMPDGRARPTTTTELVSLLATLVANGRAGEVHA